MLVFRFKFEKGWGSTYVFLYIYILYIYPGGPRTIK